MIKIDSIAYFEHRLAFLYIHGRLPFPETDHINGDRGDNRIDNLREVTSTENNQNMSTRSDNTSGCTGFTFRTERGKWKASIKVNKKLIILGDFLDWFDAVCARKSAELRFGFHPNHAR